LPVQKKVGRQKEAINVDRLAKKKVVYSFCDSVDGSRALSSKTNQEARRLWQISKLDLYLVPILLGY